MGKITNIQWCDVTWNIAVGCRKVDRDCTNCYMYRESLEGTRYNPRKVRKTKTVFNLPLKYKKTKSQVWEGRPIVFTSSLTDVFIEEIDGYRKEMWQIIKSCPHLIFLILTKRPERFATQLPADWGNGYENVWLGISAGHQAALDKRLPILLNTAAEKRILSIEPIWEGVTFYSPQLHCKTWFIKHTQDNDGNTFKETELDINLDWVIIGGESGNENGKSKYRKCYTSWIKDIISECRKSETPVFLKQVGTYLAKNMKMKDRHGGNITEFPKDLQVRETPGIYSKTQQNKCFVKVGNDE